MIGEPGREQPLIGDRGVRENEHDVRIAQRDFGKGIHRRHPAARVDQNRNIGLLRRPPDPLRRRVAETERLRSWVELDPTCPERQAALRLANGILRRIQRAIGIQPSIGLSRPRKHAVVGNLVSRDSLGIVQRKRDRLRRRRDLIQKRDQRREIERLAVLVATEMSVSIEHDCPIGEQLLKLRANRLEGLNEIHAWILAPARPPTSSTAARGQPARATPPGALAFGLGGREVAADLLRTAYDSGQQNKDQVKRDMQQGKQRAERAAGQHQDRVETGANGGSRSIGTADRI